LSKIRKALGFVTLALLSAALLVSTVGASYYGDHDRHAYLGTTNLDRNLVKPVAVNPLTQINASGVYLNYLNLGTLNVWDYLQQFEYAPLSPLAEQNSHYGDASPA
jgi:hypothetical protein